MKRKVVAYLTKDAIEGSRVIRIRAENKLIIGQPLGIEFRKKRGAFCLEMKVPGTDMRFGVPCPKIAEIRDEKRLSDQIVEIAA